MAILTRSEIIDVGLEPLTTLTMKVVQVVARTYGNGSNGGYVFLCDEKGRRLLLVQVGDLAQGGATDCRRSCQEEARRLITHPEHSLSSQSYDGVGARKGGAVRLPSGLILSFAGFPATTNEMFVISLARFLKWIGMVDAKVLAAKSDCIEFYLEVHKLVVETATSDTSV